MSLSFRSIPPTFEDFQAKRDQLERREVERGLLFYLARTATGVLGATAFVLSSLALWRRSHHDSFRASGWSMVLTAVFCLVFALGIALWEFRRKQKRVQLSLAGESTALS